MSRTVSPSSNRPYGLAFTCRMLEIARSTVYAVRPRPPTRSGALRKRGPRTEWSDGALVSEIRAVLAAAVFTGEGHRKVWARLRAKGVRTTRRRVLRLMRDEGLLAPTSSGPPRGPQAHEGTIIPESPDTMWGTDFTSTVTTREGTAYIFGVLDHATAECLSLTAVAHPTRHAAIDALREAFLARFGRYGPDVAVGLSARHDHGSCFTAELYQAELRFLGVESSPAFVRAPEGNGCIERFFRTLKEQLLWVTTYRTVEELREGLRAFREKYNSNWILERHGYLTPRAAREKLQSHAAA